MAVAPSVPGFNAAVRLPAQLTILHLWKAINYIEKETSEFVDVYFEQANVFSGLVGIFGVRALHFLSPYKKHKHPDVAQQRFPDLSLAGRLNPPARFAVESKGTTRPWALQSHYNHSGWYIVWRYLIDPTKQIKRGRSVVIWRVDVAFYDRRIGSTKEAGPRKAVGDAPIRSGLGSRRNGLRRP